MSVLCEVGSYRRTFDVAIERLFENALDWEHLPHLHGGSFTAIDLIAADPFGWRANVALDDGQRMEIELRIDASGWVTRTEANGCLQSEITTVAEAIGPDRCQVTVTFHAAASDSPKAAVGAAYARLYAKLYDEDERMMLARAGAKRRPAAEWRAMREVTLADGRFVAVPLYCPHQGLPLDADPDAAGIVTCPWHGYRFDVATGRCVSGQACGWQRR